MINFAILKQYLTMSQLCSDLQLFQHSVNLKSNPISKMLKCEGENVRLRNKEIQTFAQGLNSSKCRLHWVVLAVRLANRLEPMDKERPDSPLALLTLGYTMEHKEKAIAGSL